MLAKSWIVALLLGASGSCGGGTEQPTPGACTKGEGSGEAAGARITNTGEDPKTVDHAVCVGGGPSGISVPIKFGTLGTLDIVAALETVGTGTCGDNVSASLTDSPEDAAAYNPNATWWAGTNSSLPGSCTFSAVREGDKITGAFQGRLTRHKDKVGAPDEFINVDLTYWIQMSKE
jgi:hypothetical protein